VKYHRF